MKLSVLSTQWIFDFLKSSFWCTERFHLVSVLNDILMFAMFGFSVSQSRVGTSFLGSVIVPIFCETSGEREVSVNPSPASLETQNPDRDSQSPLYRCMEGGWLVLCVTLSKYWADIRLINVLFAIFYIFIHFIEFPRRFIVTLNIFVFLIKF